MLDVPAAKGLYAKRSLVLQYLAAALVFGSIAGVTLARGELGPGLFPLAVSVGMACWYTSKPVVQAFGQHLAIQAAPLASRRLVAYDDIVCLEQDAPRKARLTVQDANGLRTFKLPLALLSPEDGTRLVGFLRSRMRYARRAA